MKLMQAILTLRNLLTGTVPDLDARDSERTQSTKQVIEAAKRLNTAIDKKLDVARTVTGALHGRSDSNR